MRRFLQISLCVLVMAGSVSAQEDPDPKSLDENSDDKISVAEFEAYAESRLPGFEQLELFAKKVDANSDGEISADEFANRMEILERFRSGEFDDMESEEEPKAEKSKPAKKPITVAASKDQSGVNDVFSKIKALIKKNDWQAAAKLMTSEAADRTAAQMVTSSLGMQKIELPMSMPQLEDAIDDVDAVLGKHGLDKLGIETQAMLKIEIGGGGDEEGSESDQAEQEDEAKQKANSDKIIAALDKDGKRWQIVGDLWEALASSPFGMNPLVGKAENVSVDGDTAVLEVKVMPANADEEPGMMVQIMSPPMFLDFEKSNGEWKYAGLNRKKIEESMKEFHENMPDMEFEDLEVDSDDDKASTNRMIEDPSFTGTTLDGKSFELADLKSKLVLVNFWHTKSSSSIAELRRLKVFHDTFKRHGLEVVGVAKDSADSVTSFQDKNKYASWTIVVDEKSEIVDRFEIRKFPTSLLIDKEGKHIGTDLSKTKLFEEVVKQLDLNAADFADFQKKLNKASRPKPVKGVDY